MNAAHFDDSDNPEMPDFDAVRRHIALKNSPVFRAAMRKFDAETEAMVSRLREKRDYQRGRLFDDLLRDLSDD